MIASRDRYRGQAAPLPALNNTAQTEASRKEVNDTHRDLQCFQRARIAAAFICSGSLPSRCHVVGGARILSRATMARMARQPL